MNWLTQLDTPQCTKTLLGLSVMLNIFFLGVEFENWRNSTKSYPRSEIRAV